MNAVVGPFSQAAGAAHGKLRTNALSCSAAIPERGLADAPAYAMEASRVSGPSQEATNTSTPPSATNTSAAYS